MRPLAIRSDQMTTVRHGPVFEDHLNVIELYLSTSLFVIIFSYDNSHLLIPELKPNNQTNKNCLRKSHGASDPCLSFSEAL